ncbi:MAG TPA: protoporphyrinogen oxidase [Candidatus Binatia bacterium]
MSACDAIVVGGGISGLAAAHRLGELAAARGTPIRVTLLEAGTRLGGSVATERVDGFLVEKGADSFLTEKPWALALCRRLGLDDRLIGTRDTQRRTYVVHDGRLHPLPEGFLLVAPTRLGPLLRSPLFTWAGKLRMACDLVLPRGAGRADGSDESIAAFVSRRVGREAFERVVQPLVGGIYTGDADRLSIAATMPRLVEMERRSRSLILGMLRQARAAGAQSGARWGLFASFADGMQTLVDELARRLPEGAVRLGAAVASLRPPSASGASAERPGTPAPDWEVGLASGERLSAPRVIVATPAFAAADLLRPFDAGLADDLAGIPYASSAIVTLAFPRADVPHPLDGFGFVVPAIERRRSIAGSFSSVKYAGRAPEGAVLIRLFCGGALAPDVSACSDDALIALARDELRALLGIVAAPRLIRVQRHVRAMPQYHLGHRARLVRIDAAVARHPGLALAGNAYRGVGSPDSVHSGESAAERVAGVPAGGCEAPAGVGAAVPSPAGP